MACAGLWFEVNPDRYYATGGDSLNLKIEAISRNYNNIKLAKINIANSDSMIDHSMSSNVLYSISKTIKIPETENFSNPYWLNGKNDDNMFVTDDQLMRGLPWNDPDPSAIFTFIINDTEINYTVPFRYKWTDPVKGECYRPFEVIPPVTVSVPQEVLTFTSNAPKEIPVLIKSFVDNFSGKLLLQVPPGWKVDYNKDPVHLSVTGDETVIKALNPEKIILFGSFARKDFNEGSDIDLIVVNDWEENFYALHHKFW